jgi:hypothetical protein
MMVVVITRVVGDGQLRVSAGDLAEFRNLLVELASLLGQIISLQLENIAFVFGAGKLFSHPRKCSFRSVRVIIVGGIDVWWSDQDVKRRRGYKTLCVREKE